MKKLNGVLLWMLASASAALASTSSGTEFQSLYNKMLSYVQGLPGIMAALTILLVSLYLAFFGGKGPMVFFGGIIAAAAIFILPNIVQGMGGATF